MSVYLGVQFIGVILCTFTIYPEYMLHSVTRYLYPEISFIVRNTLGGMIELVCSIYSPAKRIGGTDYLIILCICTTPILCYTT